MKACVLNIQLLRESLLSIDVNTGQNNFTIMLQSGSIFKYQFKNLEDMTFVTTRLNFRSILDDIYYLDFIFTITPSTFN